MKTVQAKLKLKCWIYLYRFFFNGKNINVYKIVRITLQLQ